MTRDQRRLATLEADGLRVEIANAIRAVDSMMHRVSNVLNAKCGVAIVCGPCF